MVGLWACCRAVIAAVLLHGFERCCDALQDPLHCLMLGKREVYNNQKAAQSASEATAPCLLFCHSAASSPRIALHLEL